jgi:hypothetical protein
MTRKRLTNLSKSGALFSARMAGAGLMFLVQAAIARWWGSDVLADYLLLISAANIAAMVMPLGFQTIGSYFRSGICLAWPGWRPDAVCETRLPAERHKRHVFRSCCLGDNAMDRA